tara:strand:+ start:648 stop:842 length:195 start_codon:yes stop_codon:yes gene_type:complete
MSQPANKKKYNKALRRLIETRRLTSDMLNPLGVPFEWFLRLANNSDDLSKKKIEALIIHLSKFK